MEKGSADYLVFVGCQARAFETVLERHFPEAWKTYKDAMRGELIEAFDAGALDEGAEISEDIRRYLDNH